MPAVSWRRGLCGSLIALFLLAYVFDSPAAAREDLESAVPSNWSAASGSLSISGDHWKLGSQSLRWDWTAGDTLTIASPGIPAADVTDFYKHTCDFWVYNPSPVAGGVLTVEFANTAGATQYAFDFQLGFSGWRRAVRSYRYDMTGPKTTATFGSVRFKAPATGSGSLFFDDLGWVGPRFTRVRDWQNPGITGYLSDTGVQTAWTAVPDIPADTPTPEELAALATVRSRWLAAAKGSSAPSAASVTTANTAFAALNIVEDSNGIRGVPLNADTQSLEGWTLTLARDAAWGGSATSTASGAKVVQLVRHLLDQGLAAGSNELASNGSAGYDFRDFPTGMILLASAYDATDRQRVRDMLWWNYLMGRFWTADWTRNTDHLHLTSFQMLGAILFLSPDDTAATRDLKGYKRFMERFFIPTDSTEDGFKPDGCAFHHGSHYIAYMYALPTVSDCLYHLRGTPFQVDASAYQNLRAAFLAMMRMSADGTGTGFGYYPQSLCGRHPFSTTLPFSRDHLRRLGEWGGRITGATADETLARAYNRRYGVNDYPLFTPFGVEPAPDGFFQFNHSPLGIYRKGTWLAAIHGTNSAFWSAEIYSTANRYGRYQGYGSLEILRSGTSPAAAGQQAAGYDWNHPPGTTTIVLPDQLLLAANDREDVRSQLNHAAALAFHDGSCGLYACKFQETSADARHNPTFRWRKSWFAFGNQIICLGSDITNNDSANRTATTVFQSPLSAPDSPVTADGVALTGLPHDGTLDGNAPHSLLDAQGNGYWLPAGGTDLRVIRSNQSSPNQNGTGAATTGDFATAWLDHGTSPGGAAYEYAVFPATDEAAMAAVATTHGNPATKPYLVLQQNTGAHVVRWLADGSTSYSVFEPGDLPPATRNAGLLRGASRPCLLTTRLGNDDARLSIVDPEMVLLDGMGVPTVLDLVINGSWTLDNPPPNAEIIAVNTFSTTLRVTLARGIAAHLRLLETTPETHRWADIGSAWSDPANWGSHWGGSPPANSPDADIADLGAATVQPVLDSAFAVKGMVLAGGTTLSGTGTLTLGAEGIVATGAANACDLADIALAAPQTWWVDDGPLAVASAITGAGSGLTKDGPGILSLAGASAFTGPTVIAAGTLEVSGSLGATSVEIRESATLTGSGTIGGGVRVCSGGRIVVALGAAPSAQAARQLGGTLVLDPGNELDLTAEAPLAPGIYPLLAATAVSGTPDVVRLPPGVDGEVRVSGNRLVLLLGVDSFDAWLAAFDLGENGGFADDPDADGLPNGIEFVLASDPTDPSSGESPTARAAADTMVIEFRRNDDAKGLALLVETSDDLVSWPESGHLTIAPDAAASSPGVMVIDDPDAGSDTIRVEIPLNGRPRLFARVRVTR